MNRSAMSTWSGTGTDGTGTISCDSGALDGAPYSSKSRFTQQDEPTGANPEELLASAHAASFSMALAHELTDAGHPPLSMQTEVRVQVVKPTAHWTIPAVRIHCTVAAPGLSPERLLQLAHEARLRCTVTQALRAELTITATLGKVPT